MKTFLGLVFSFCFGVMAFADQMNQNYNLVARGEGSESVKCPIQINYDQSRKIVLDLTSGNDFLNFSDISICSSQNCLKGPSLGCSNFNYCLWDANSFRSISDLKNVLLIEYGSLPKSATTTSFCMYSKVK